MKLLENNTVDWCEAYLAPICSMKGGSASCSAPRSLNTPTNISTAGAEPFTGDKANGEVYGGVDRGIAGGVTPSTGSGGCTRAAGGGAGGGSCGAGVGKGPDGGGAVCGGRAVAAGVKWTAVERRVLPPLLRIAKVQMEESPAFCARAVHVGNNRQSAADQRGCFCIVS